MKEITLTPEQLKEAITFGKLIQSGLYSRVFTYKNRLIKLDQCLYDLLKEEDIFLSELAILERYKNGKEDFNSREQLEYLLERQPFIRPKVPEGIITIKSNNSQIDGIIPGIILYPFTGYSQMKQATFKYKQLLIVLKKIFDDIKGLADNEISHEDLHEENILIKGYDPQIIDMSGPEIKAGKDFVNANIMYECFGDMINSYNTAFGFRRMPLDRNVTEQDLSRMIIEFERQIKKK